MQQLARRLLSLNDPHPGRQGRTRGLSTAELVGIIVIVGILGALGGTYISGLVSTAKTNTISQNIQSLNTVAASAIAGGATVNAGPAAGNIDTTGGSATASAAAALAIINSLNAGVTVGTGSQQVTYQMSPPISAAAIATLTSTNPTYLAAVNGSTITFSPGAGTTP